MYVYNSTSGNGVVSCHFSMTFIITFHLDSLAPAHGANSCAAAERGKLSKAMDAPSLRNAYAEGFAEASRVFPLKWISN